ncbi:MAG: ATPase [Proteobacteria bacterium]|nr:ATPase [Pseudomonadota bacterium]
MPTLPRPLLPLLLLAAGLAPAVAAGEVVAAGAGGFEVRAEALYPGDPASAWRRLLRPRDWWDPAHTYSKDARNLSLEATPGGCWCERLAGGGFVRHLEVVYLAPRATLRLSGGLGPLQGMGASGSLTFTLQAEGTATRIRLDYVVAGFAPAGFADLARAVDGVLGAQLARYAAP